MFAGTEVLSSASGEPILVSVRMLEDVELYHPK